MGISIRGFRFFFYIKQPPNIQELPLLFLCPCLQCLFPCFDVWLAKFEKQTTQLWRLSVKTTQSWRLFVKTIHIGAGTLFYQHKTRRNVVASLFVKKSQPVENLPGSMCCLVIKTPLCKSMYQSQRTRHNNLIKIDTRQW